MKILSTVLDAMVGDTGDHTPYQYPIQAPVLPPGVVPTGSKPAVAMDGNINPANGFLMMGMANSGFAVGFPGYPYLANLSARVEYRNIAGAYAMELTREWIKFKSTDDDKDRITLIEKEFIRLGVKDAFRKIIEHDGFFGRGQILMNMRGDEQNLDRPLIVGPKTISPARPIESLAVVEPMWTTPNTYNSLYPQRADFYRPDTWWMMGQEVHNSRFLMGITRPVPDILKAAFNFSGISLSQLVEPYVENWLTTRQSVADLIKNFSIVGLGTDLGALLQGGDSSAVGGIMSRIKMWAALRNNKSVFTYDKQREEISQQSVALGGLHELQAQAQEHMCSASGEPAVVLLGVSPTGFGNLSEGEIKSWSARCRGIQEAVYRPLLTTLLHVVELSLFGEIDDAIDFEFVPLDQPTRKELSDIRKQDADTACALIDRGVLSADEERDRIRRDSDSLYTGLDGEAPGTEEDNDEEIFGDLSGGAVRPAGGGTGAGAIQQRASGERN